MIAIQTILHPTDFSEHSDYAFQLARALAHDFGALLVVVHVAPPPMVAYGGVMTPPPPPADDLSTAKEQLQKFQTPEPGLRLERLLEEGDAATEILRVARELKADLIAMGTHGRTGLGRVLMGSVAEQVVRRATCAVLTVKARVAAGSAP